MYISLESYLNPSDKLWNRGEEEEGEKYVEFKSVSNRI